MIKRLIIWTAYATLGLAWVLMVAGLYFTYFDRAMPSINILSYVSPDTLHPGETLELHYSVDRIRACYASYTRILESRGSNPDSYLIERGERQITEQDLGKNVTIVVQVKIPQGVKPGYYTFYTRVWYSCNPMQKLVPIVIDTPQAIVKIEN